jgi:hypothetical protein
VHGLQEFTDIGTAGGFLPDFEQHGLDGFQPGEATFHQFSYVCGICGDLAHAHRKY